jgi:hypothetical protein
MRSRHSNMLARAHFLSTKAEPKLVCPNYPIPSVFSVLTISSITSPGNSCQKRLIVSSDKYWKPKPSSNKNSMDLENYIQMSPSKMCLYPKRSITTRPKRRWVSLELSLPLILTLKLILLISLHKAPSPTSPRLEGTPWRNIMERLLLKRMRIQLSTDLARPCCDCIDTVAIYDLKI